MKKQKIWLSVFLVFLMISQTSVGFTEHVQPLQNQGENILSMNSADSVNYFNMNNEPNPYGDPVDMYELGEHVLVSQKSPDGLSPDLNVTLYRYTTREYLGTERIARIYKTDAEIMASAIDAVSILLAVTTIPGLIAKVTLRGVVELAVEIAAFCLEAEPSDSDTILSFYAYTSEYWAVVEGKEHTGRYLLETRTVEYFESVTEIGNYMACRGFTLPERSYNLMYEPAIHMYFREHGHIFLNCLEAICYDCGMERIVYDHKYDNDCDSTCNYCGALDPTRFHQFTEWYDNPDSMNIYSNDACMLICSKCYMESTKLPHDLEIRFRDLLGGERCGDLVGAHVYCDRCKFERIPNLPLPHNWIPLQIIKTPTCSETGTMRSECARCHINEDLEIPKTPHAWGDWEDTEPATCVEGGEARRPCRYGCGAFTPEMQRTNINPYNHTWSDQPVVTKPATCSQEGSQYRPCSNGCGKFTAPEVIPTNESHTWSPYYRDHTPATCAKPAEQRRPCSNNDAHWSDDFVFVGQKLEHNWVAREVIQPATCYETGVQKFECTLCQTFEGRELPKTNDHHWVWKTIEEPTCDEPGQEGNVCSDISSHVQTSSLVSIPKNGHRWILTTTITPATCGASGHGVFKCSNDPSHTITGSIDPNPNNHTWGAWVVTKPMTCLADGEERQMCNGCGTLSPHMDKIDSPKSHSWGGGITYVAAKCTTPDVQRFYCTRPGCSAYDSQTIYPNGIGHSMQSYINYATCTTSGQNWSECVRSGCGYSTSPVYIPPTGHYMINSTTPATCTSSGSNRQACDLCGYSTSSTIPAKGHSYGSWYYLNTTYHRKECSRCSAYTQSYHSPSHLDCYTCV